MTFSKRWRTDFRSKVLELLESQQIQFSSVDFVRFRWLEQDGKSPRKTVTSRPTIWVGVLPDTTTGDAAFDSAQGILQLVKEYDIDDIDVAYRESTARFLANSPLLDAVQQSQFSQGRRRLDHHRP